MELYFGSQWLCWVPWLWHFSVRNLLSEMNSWMWLSGKQTQLYDTIYLWRQRIIKNGLKASQSCSRFQQLHAQMENVCGRTRELGEGALIFNQWSESPVPSAVPCRITSAQRFPFPLHFYCSSFFPGVSFFIICSLFKIIKEWNIWFMAIILHIRGGKYTVCLVALVFQFAELISSPNFLTHSFFKLLQENLMWHSEQKTNLIYLFYFFSSSLSHPCNISAWLAAYVNGICGGISIYGWILRQGTMCLPLPCEDRFQNNTKVSLTMKQTSHFLWGKTLGICSQVFL